MRARQQFWNRLQPKTPGQLVDTQTSRDQRMQACCWAIPRKPRPCGWVKLRRNLHFQLMTLPFDFLNPQFKALISASMLQTWWKCVQYCSRYHVNNVLIELQWCMHVSCRNWTSGQTKWAVYSSRQMHQDLLHRSRSDQIPIPIRSQGVYKSSSTNFNKKFT